MRKFKSVFIQVIQWGVAILCAAFIMNLLTFTFYNPCQELIRKQGATTGFLLPDSKGVYGLEGYCIANIDENGYVNRDLKRASDYYIVTGASHTEGLFIPLKNRYSDILNSMLTDKDELKVYNIGRSGNFFSIVLQHLDGIIGEFPDAKAIIIETDSLAYDTKALYDSQIQVGYDPSENAKDMLAGLSTGGLYKIKIKQALPLIRELHKQYLTYQEANSEKTSSDILDPDFWAAEYSGDFENALDSLMSFIRSKTDKQVIILYHPAIELDKEGNMNLLTNHAEVYYKKICPKYDIDFIDMSEVFIKAYEEDYIIPYGFNNTTPGSGHINAAAHRMMAEELYKVIKE
ncbi:MAG: hypothetical protein K6E98_08480 [Lachnospiraceae bacterium]|nr:hypothetical protein [Lachnospiraceae bacterium]